MKKCIIAALLLFVLSPGILYAAERKRVNYMESGHKYAQNSEWDKAIAEYKKEVAAYPKSDCAHYNLGTMYFFKYREPSTRTNNAPGNEELNNLLEQAVREWEKTVSLNDDFWEAHYYLGMHYNNTGRFEEAEREFKKTVAVNPKYIDVYLVLGGLYLAKNRLDLAVECYQKALHIEPESEVYHFNLLDIYHKQGNFKEAQKEYRFLKAKKSVFLNEQLYADIYE